MFDPEMEDVVIATRQPRLLHLESALSLRMGAAFFRALPESPGVYFFYDEADALLYIGQSSDLRARINSYRHVSPEKNPKRTLRLVARTVRIIWECCESAAAAIERERILLLTHRPPFNRAGVWQGDPWWLSWQADGGVVRLELSRDPSDAGIGPLVPGCRYVLASLLRCWLRTLNHDWTIANFPHGLMAAALPRKIRLAVDGHAAALATLQACLRGDVEAMIQALNALPAPASQTEQEFWQEEIERVEHYAGRLMCQTPKLTESILPESTQRAGERLASMELPLEAD